jgi:Cep192 domain 4
VEQSVAPKDEGKLMGMFKRGRAIGPAFTAVSLVALALLAPAALGGGAPSIAFTPASLDYGEVGSGTTASHTFALKNTGGSATGALTVSLTGSSLFTKTADACTAVSLGPNKSCSVTVQYAGGGVYQNGPFTATLTASSKKPLALATASLQADTKLLEQVDCERAGGTFTWFPAGYIWTCGPLASPSEIDPDSYVSLFIDCELFDGGVLSWDAGSGLYRCSAPS